MYRKEIAAQIRAGGSPDLIWAICKSAGFLALVVLLALPIGCQTEKPSPTKTQTVVVPYQSATPWTVPIGRTFVHHHADARLGVGPMIDAGTCAIVISIDGSQQIRTTMTVDDLHGILSEPDVWGEPVSTETMPGANTD